MLIFEKSRPGRGCDLLPECDVEVTLPQEKDKREKKLHLPELSEIELSRHYTELAKKSHGVNDGFYPLGSCTMKYNPKINEDMAALPGFTEIHPLQPTHTVQGCLEVIKESENLLCEITGMDRMTFQPAAGAHGEFTGLLLIKAYHKSRGDEKRKKIIVPDSAHGTNPASAAMAGFQVVSIESAPDGGVDLEKLQEVCGEDTAGLMLTNPNTVGDTCVCTFVEKEKEQTVEAEYVLCAVGRCPNTDGLFAEGAAPDMERGRVLVNDKFESSIPGVYAIGDLIFGAQLAHAASAQGIVVAEQLAGKEPSVNLDVVPGCVYTDPEIASAGITEDAAKEQGIKVKTGKFIMSANGKSLITKEERGFIKIVADEETDVILGAQMMCARATDMVGEFVTAIANKMTVAQLLKGMRAHPTYNEGIGEALEEAEGGAIHVVPKKR